MSDPLNAGRRRGRATVALLAAAAVLAPVAAARARPAQVQVAQAHIGQTHEDGIRTRPPRLRQPPPVAPTDQRRPERVREDSLTRPERAPSTRRETPYRDDTGTQVDLSLPRWAKDSIGLHPVRLSVNVQAEFAEYLKKAYPLVFVISRHGFYTSWRYCRPGGHCNAGAAARSALARCDAIRLDNPCYIYAVGRKPVWQGKVERATALGAAVHAAAGTEVQGPDKARGVIFYFRGYGAWRFPPRLPYDRVPPYLLRFARDGWDVKTVEVPYYNRPPVNLPRIVALIHRTAAAARTQGYRRVVLAGQSRGAWEILQASDGTMPVDGVIMVSPAAHGTRYLRNGRRNPNFDRGNPAFAALLKHLKAPRVAFAFFRRDPFMTPARAGLARTGLADRPGMALFIIDHPAGLPGHNAAWSPNFARAWGACLERFIDAPAKPGPFTCPPARFKIDAPELIYSSAQLFAHGARALGPKTIKGLVDGKRLYTAPEPRNEGWWAFGRDGRVTMKLAGAWQRPNPIHAYWETRGNRVCIIDSLIHGSRVFCYTVYRVTDNVLAFVMKSGIVRLMYIR